MRIPLVTAFVFLVGLGHAEAKTHHYRHHHHSHGRSSTSLAGFPEPLVLKVHQIIDRCGSHIISAFRPGARVAGSGAVSNHALRKAVDIGGNPKCIYAQLKGWPGGYSTDYGRVNHVHISYNHNKEWGMRFAHYQGQYTRYAGRHARRHYAHHHYHRRHYAAS